MENNFEGKPGDLRFEIYEVKHFVGFGNVWNSAGGFCWIWSPEGTSEHRQG